MVYSMLHTIKIRFSNKMEENSEQREFHCNLKKEKFHSKNIKKFHGGVINMDEQGRKYIIKTLEK